MVDLVKVVTWILAYDAVELTAREAEKLNRIVGLEVFTEGLNRVGPESAVAERLYAALPQDSTLRLLADTLLLAKRCALRRLRLSYKAIDSGVTIHAAANWGTDTEYTVHLPWSLRYEAISILDNILLYSKACGMACENRAALPYRKIVECTMPSNSPRGYSHEG